MSGYFAGISIIIVSLAMAGLATWMASRNNDGDTGKVIWSLVQLMSVLVFAMGGFFLYLAINTKTPPPVVESSGSTLPVAPQPQAPKPITAPNPPAATQPKLGTLRVNIVDAAGNPVEGARVTVTFSGKQPSSTDSTSIGAALFGGGQLGSSFQVVVESQLGTRQASGSLVMTEQAVFIRLPGVPAPANSQPSSQPPQSDAQPPQSSSSGATDQANNTPPADEGVPPANGNG
jgi:hypothetical protein